MTASGSACRSDPLRNPYRKPKKQLERKLSQPVPSRVRAGASASCGASPRRRVAHLAQLYSPTRCLFPIFQMMIFHRRKPGKTQPRQRPAAATAASAARAATSGAEGVIGWGERRRVSAAFLQRGRREGLLFGKADRTIGTARPTHSLHRRILNAGNKDLRIRPTLPECTVQTAWNSRTRETRRSSTSARLLCVLVIVLLTYIPVESSEVRAAQARRNYLGEGTTLRSPV